MLQYCNRIPNEMAWLFVIIILFVFYFKYYYLFFILSFFLFVYFIVLVKLIFKQGYCMYICTV